ncbi:DsbA family protein [Pseudomonas syringae pv. tagetis]|uniref:DsbA family protein n=2 Tax=Pseudomonas syringae group genomosp. 7 TaxID=251699 RepID=A0A0N8T3S6_9PSED|nr:DsbA family protein [Pseudomonas syringae group genomosp. 7]KPX42091.1 thioredoxin domain protein [Pseudomonas syringae pv. helianthi]KPY86416.1 putative FrnE-like dithiol-disulfide isomerase involved in polyketide biosynthesi [Pseudomonas syringae pv. tagetis]RMR07895.1 putative FrnE-like dithiol-disulfide isomerase involved in polyketide biosynthesi [Pseudomonas syringae pv. helianthi]RMV45995.1 putative FrnE-like dithiol-disulfide isomerase involved in polyketide biosynthesi [Pseudomonas 
MNTVGPLKIDVWSDYVCPFCYLQLTVLEQLQRTYGEQLEFSWHAFELRPDPLALLDPNADYLRETWSRSVLPMADRRQVMMKMPAVQPRSRKVLEAAAFARNAGSFDKFHKEAFKAFFEKGLDIGETLTLLELAATTGLDRQAMERALNASEYESTVLEDQQLAQKLGLRAVPVLLLRRNDEALEQARVFNGTLPFDRLSGEIDALSAWC